MNPGRHFVKAKTFLVKRLDRQTLATTLTGVAVFLLPWQARWIYATVTLNGEAWEYGKLSVYVLEFILFVAMILRGRPQWIEGYWPVRRITILFLGTCFLSLSLGWFFQGSLFQLLHICFAYTLFSLVLDTRVNSKMLGWSFLAGLVVPSLLAWYQVLVGSSPASTFLGMAFQEASVPGTSVVAMEGERLLRAYGSFPHPNIFGGYLAVAFFVLLNLEVKKEGRWGAWTLSVLLGSALVLTFSRSACLALVMGVILGLAVLWWLRARFSSHIKSVAYFFLLGCLLAGSIFSQAIFTRFDASERLEVLSVSERITGYEQWDEVFLQNPITGVGSGGYTAALSVLFPGQSAWSYQPVHNAFLLLMAEIGLVGFITFIWWLISIGKTITPIFREPQRAIGLGLGVCLLTLALFDHYLWSLWPGLALSAFVFAMLLRWRQES